MMDGVENAVQSGNVSIWTLGAGVAISVNVKKDIRSGLVIMLTISFKE